MTHRVHALRKQLADYVEHAYRVRPPTLLLSGNGWARWSNIAHAGNAMTLKQQKRVFDAFGVIN